MSSEVNIVDTGSAEEWRAWLARNCRSATEVWLVFRHHGSGTPSLRYQEAVEQALCFGWIDGLHRRCGAGSSQLRFTPRTARSRWSQLNRQRAAKMTGLGLMTEHGRAAIEQAKAAGTWQLLPDEQSWAIPDDLQEQLDGNDAARTNFELPAVLQAADPGMDSDRERARHQAAPDRSNRQPRSAQHPGQPPP